MGTNERDSGGEVVGMEVISICERKECEDVEVVCNSDEVKIMDEVERGIEVGVFCDTKGL